MKQTRHGNGQFPDKARYEAGILRSEAGQAVPGLWLGQRHLGAEDRRGHRAGPAAPENRPRCQAALAEMSEAGQRHSMFHNSPGPLSGKEKNRTSASHLAAPRPNQRPPERPGETPRPRERDIPGPPRVPSGLWAGGAAIGLTDVALGLDLSATGFTKGKKGGGGYDQTHKWFAKQSLGAKS